MLVKVEGRVKGVGVVLSDLLLELCGKQLQHASGTGPKPMVGGLLCRHAVMPPWRHGETVWFHLFKNVAKANGLCCILAIHSSS